MAGKSTGQIAKDQALPQNSSNAGTSVSARPAEIHYCGTIEGYSDDHSELRLAKPTVENRCEKPDTPLVVIHVQGQALKDSLRNWAAGDRVIAGVSVEDQNGVKALTLQDLEPQTSETGVGERWLAGLGAAVALLALTWIFSRDVRGLLFIGEDDRYSNSKTQISLWFGVVIVSYLAVFVLRWWHTGLIGHIGIPTNLLMLSGLSGLTFAGAKAITTSKDSAAAASAAGAAPAVAALVQRKTAAPHGPSFPSDLLKDDNGKFDFGDYQMLVVTLIAILSYGFIVYNFLGTIEQRASISLPDVDGTILALMGVGHGAYLTKKAVTGVKQ